jgi:DNA-binding response OmpR family regulator
VLIVDASRESRDVLRTLLEHRGVTTLETGRPEEAVHLADKFLPNLIVLDAESDQSAAGQPTNDLREAAARTDTPIVILGKIRQQHSESASDQFVAKPYHYGPLIRKIDDLLAAA